MTRSSRHKSHRQSKHSSKDYSDSEEDVKLKEKSGKNDNLVGDYRGTTAGEKLAGEKRKISSNGDASEEYVMSKRRKEKVILSKERADVNVDVGVDRWNAYGEEKGDASRNLKKEMHKADSSKIDSKLKESYSKEESLKLESKVKSKKYGNGSGADINEDNTALLVVEKEESERKGESKRKSERDSSGRKEGKDFKDKGFGSEKEKRIVGDSKRADSEAKMMDVHFGQKQGSNLVDFCEETKAKRGRETTERSVKDQLRDLDLDKELEKGMRRRKDGSVVKDKHYDDFKEIDERQLSSRGDAKDVKYREDRHKDGDKEAKCHKDGQKDSGHRNNKYREDADKYSKSRDGNYCEDDRDARYRDERRREVGNRDSRRGDEVFWDDTEQESRHKDEKYLDGTGRGAQNKGDKYTEDAERSTRRRDDRYRGDKDYRHRDDYREDGDRDGRYKEDKRWEDIEYDSWRKDSKRGDNYVSEGRQRESKSRDQRASRDFSGDKSDPKHSRDDAYADDRLSRKLITYDDSPKVGDHSAKYKDDQGRRKTTGKGDYEDTRSWSTKDQVIESEKKSGSSARMDIATDRGRSVSRNADIELTSHGRRDIELTSHGRRHRSPSPNSHVTRDPYRIPKQEHSKYDAYEERDRYTVTSSRDDSGAVGGSARGTSSRSLEKHGLKEDGQLGELSAERRSRLEIRSLPLQLADRSPASSTDRRYFTRSDGKQGFDAEDSAQRSGALRDAKGYSGKEGRGNHGLVSGIHPGDELPQTDVDNSSISSPVTRNGHLSNSFKSIPPSPLFRTGLENPLILGSAEEDSRSKSNNHNRRIGNPNLGSLQGNAFRGVPNWPPPMVNGFMPFPQGPPFHSVMQQFAGPPMFGGRSPLELSHPSPYRIPDADRFSGPGRPMGWRNPVDDSCPPPMYVWDSSSAVFGDESQIYGRPDWDHSRSLPGSQGWDTRGDLWTGPHKISSMDTPSSDKKNDFSQIVDEALVGHSTQQVQSELTPDHKHAENTGISHSRDELRKNASEAPEETSDITTFSRKDDSHLFHFYFCKLDISADLTEPELFNKCTGFLDVDQNVSSVVQDSKLFYAEDAVEATAASPYKVGSSSSFSATSDSVFQKAVSLYKRQKEELGALCGGLSAKFHLIPKSNEKLNAQDNNDKYPAGCIEDVGYTPNSKEKVESHEVEGPIKNPHMNSDPSVANVVEELETVATSSHINMEVDSASNNEPQGCSLENPSSVGVGEVHMEFSGNNGEMNVLDTKCGPVSNSGVSHEAMMPESIESRIHHSPESTH